MAGLVPAIPIRKALHSSNRDHRHEAGDDMGGCCHHRFFHALLGAHPDVIDTPSRSAAHRRGAGAKACHPQRGARRSRCARAACRQGARPQCAAGLARGRRPLPRRHRRHRRLRRPGRPYRAVRSRRLALLHTAFRMARLRGGGGSARPLRRRGLEGCGCHSGGDPQPAAARPRHGRRRPQPSFRETQCGSVRGFVGGGGRNRRSALRAQQERRDGRALAALPARLQRPCGNRA